MMRCTDTFANRLVLAAVLLCAATDAQAQSNEPARSGRLQLGPFAVTPSIGLTDFGVDSNVFNEVENPKRDFTFTLSPQLDAKLRAGRSRTNITGRADLLYFQEYSSERSIDGTFDARFELSLNRITPFVATNLFRGRQRLGYEIDLRSRRVTNKVVVGTEARVGGRTRIAVSGSQVTYRHDADAFFLGTSLEQVLNHTTESAAVEFKRELTVLTTAVVQGEVLRDRFEFASDRNADSVRVLAGFDTDPLALIGGRVRIGYRTFNVNGGLPGFTGVVASITSGFTVKGRTRVELVADRDVNYSFEATYPYFVITGGTVSMTPRLTNHWDVQARGGAERLAYRAVDGLPLADRVDRYVLFGGGVGYHIGRDVRFGFSVDRQRRSSPLQTRDYEGYRIGSTVTYGR